MQPAKSALHFIVLVIGFIPVIALLAYGGFLLWVGYEMSAVLWRFALGLVRIFTS